MLNTSPPPPPASLQLRRKHSSRLPHCKSPSFSDSLTLKSSSMVISGCNSLPKTHYDVLSVKEDASYDEIRSSYKAAILNSHPDKLQSKSETSKRLDKFLDIQKAWEVLSELKSRSNYDKQLRATRHAELDVVADEIKLEEMVEEVVDDSREFFHQCRCGDYFSVSSAELEKMGISLADDRTTGLNEAAGTASVSVLLPCGSCSIKIRLIIETSC